MSHQQSCVLFHFRTPGISRRDVRAFAGMLQADVAGGRGFVCLVAGDGELLRLNRDFLKKNYPADVLSFPALEAGASLGEIAISFERAREHASEHGHTVEAEIRILMLHGVLHLLGFDHERDSGEMARAERKWRGHFELPTGLIERSRPRAAPGAGRVRGRVPA